MTRGRENATILMFLALSLLAAVGLGACTCESEKPPLPPPTSQADKEPIHPSVSTYLATPLHSVKDEEWLDRKAVTRPAPEPVATFGKDGVGIYTACMTHEEVKKQEGVRPCKGVLASGYESCYAFADPEASGLPPLSLWVQDGKMLRAVITSPAFKSAEGLGVGDTLADLRAVYTAPSYLRSDKGAWIFGVAGRATFFHLADTSSADPLKIPPPTKIAKVEVVFPCGRSVTLPGRSL